MVYFEAFENALRVLDSVDESKFSMHSFYNYSTGKRCHVGHCTQDKWFIDKGLTYTDETECVKYQSYYGLDAAATFFGITDDESDDLFGAHSRTKQEQKQIIIEFLKSKGWVEKMNNNEFVSEFKSPTQNPYKRGYVEGFNYASSKIYLKQDVKMPTNQYEEGNNFIDWITGFRDGVVHAKSFIES